jgi:DNA (cytosine-5)-methyltransferase 1
VSTLRAISLFSGAGGLDMGLEAAGFSISLAVERDKICCQTLRTNHQWQILDADLEHVPARQVRRRSGLHRRECDLLVAGPPCQPFSKSANWALSPHPGMLDPRSASMRALVAVVEDMLPRALLIENVPGFRRTGDHGGLGFLLRELLGINDRHGVNYQPVWRVLNAADYGVPQVRRRLFLVAFRDGRPFEFPAPWPSTMAVTCWDAIGELSVQSRTDLAVGGRWGALLPSIPEGQNYLWHTNRGGGVPLFGWRTKYWSFLLKLAKDQPAWTIPAQPAQNAGPFHWHNRRLSTREMLRLQTFPRTVFIAGSRADRQRQIGNAVPSLLAEVLGRALAKELSGYCTTIRALKLRIHRSAAPVPPPETPKPPDACYRHLIGDHPDHPGVGQGPRYRPLAVQVF